MTCTEYWSHDLSTIEVSASIKRNRTPTNTEYVLKTFDLATATEEQLRFIPAESVPPALVWKPSEHENTERDWF